MSRELLSQISAALRVAAEAAKNDAELNPELNHIAKDQAALQSGADICQEIIDKTEPFQSVEPSVTQFFQIKDAIFLAQQYIQESLNMGEAVSDHQEHLASGSLWTI